MQHNTTMISCTANIKRKSICIPTTKHTTLDFVLKKSELSLEHDFCREEISNNYCEQLKENCLNCPVVEIK